MADALDNTIKQNAEGPRRASGDAGSIEQHGIEEQIAADKYIESKKAMRNKGMGIKLVKLTPGGTA